MAALYPEDFQGAAPLGHDVIFTSSDEDEPMDNLTLTSVFNLQLSSEDEEENEEINLMASCVEMEMSAPTPITGPSYAVKTKEEVVTSGLPNYETQTRPIKPRSMFNPSFFSLGKGNGPISRDDRHRYGHPITLCRMVDTLHHRKEDQLTIYAQQCIVTPMAINTKGLSKIWTQSQNTFKEWD